MTYFEEAALEVLGIEGGYANNPHDRGGATSWGITEATARRHGYTGPIEELPKDVALHIYESSYWDSARLQLTQLAMISKPIAFEVFEAGVNVGTQRAAEWLQRSLNLLNRHRLLWPDLVVDGVLGLRTRAAMRSLLAVRGRRGEEVLVKLMNVFQGHHYIELAERDVTQKEFIFGWFDRRVSMRLEAGF